MTRKIFTYGVFFRKLMGFGMVSFRLPGAFWRPFFRRAELCRSVFFRALEATESLKFFLEAPSASKYTSTPEQVQKKGGGGYILAP